MTERQDIIKITGLQKSFGDLHVLKRIDLNIKEKEVVVIIGPSGSGKSTLLRCINYLEEPTGGEIVFDNIPWTGKRISMKSARKWAWCSSVLTCFPI